MNFCIVDWFTWQGLSKHTFLLQIFNKSIPYKYIVPDSGGNPKINWIYQDMLNKARILRTGSLACICCRVPSFCTKSTPLVSNFRGGPRKNTWKLIGNTSAYLKLHLQGFISHASGRIGGVCEQHIMCGHHILQTAKNKASQLKIGGERDMLRKF